MREMQVSRSLLGDAWPLTVEAGTLRAYQINPDQVVPILEISFRTESGRVYALNGIAQRQPQYGNLHEIWSADPRIPDAYKSVAPLLVKAEELFVGDWVQQATKLVPQAIAAMQPVRHSWLLMMSETPRSSRIRVQMQRPQGKGGYLVLEEALPVSNPSNPLRRWTWATPQANLFGPPLALKAEAYQWLPLPEQSALAQCFNWMQFLRQRGRSLRLPTVTVDGWSIDWELKHD